MKMKCRKCGRIMDLWKFATYVEAYFIKLVAAAAVPFIVTAITQKLSSGTRGIIDSSMDGLANNFEIACPKCKKPNCWDPAPGEEKSKTSQKTMML